MKSTKRITAIFFAFLLLVSVFAGCSKDDSNKDTTRLTTLSSDTEDKSDKTEKATQSSNSTKAGDIIYFGQYEQDNDLTNGKEKIAWRVLTVENGNAFLLSDKILDAKPYNEENKDVTWETCTLRTWLNNDFYNAVFTSAEQEKILTTDVTNEDNPEFGTNGGNNTKDKVFLLSFGDIMNSTYGFNIEPDNEDLARQAQGTAFAKSNGVLIRDGSYHFANSYWWLRSPAGGPNYAGIVFYNGSVSYFNYYDVNSTNNGVRPALWINL